MRRLSFHTRIAVISALVSTAVLVLFGLLAWSLVYRQLQTVPDVRLRHFGERWATRLRADSAWDAVRRAFNHERRPGRPAIPLVTVLNNAEWNVLFQTTGWPENLTPPAPDEIQPSTRVATPPGGVETPPAFAPPERTAARGRDTSGRRRAPWMRGRRRLPPGPGLMPGPISLVAPPVFMTREADGIPWRMGVFRNREVTVITAVSVESLRDEADKVRTAFLLAIPLALICTGAGAWFVSTRATSPIEEIRRTAEQITARGLDRRVPVAPTGDELERLTRVLNDMLDRLQRSFEQATRFSADASHELKTPLTIMQGELESAMAQSHAGSPEQVTFARLLEETQRLKEITGALLRLSRADAGHLALSVGEVDLSAEVQGLAEDAEVLGMALRLGVETDIQPGVMLQADRALLRQAFQNLLSNAVKYNKPEGIVRIALSPGHEGKGAELILENSGQEIPVEERARVFERFHRWVPGEESVSKGVGLGLNLALEIIHAHGGDLRLDDSTSGLTRFVVVLPEKPTSWERAVT